MRNEDYDRELLVAVAVICVIIAAVASLFETSRPSSAMETASRLQAPAGITPVRVVGTPLVLNTNPSQR
jgi:hypothetical protein